MFTLVTPAGWQWTILYNTTGWCNKKEHRVAMILPLPVKNLNKLWYRVVPYKSFIRQNFQIYGAQYLPRYYSHMCHSPQGILIWRTVWHQWGVLTSQVIQTFNTTNHQFKTYHSLAHWCCPQVRISMLKTLFLILLVVPSFSLNCRKWKMFKSGWTKTYPQQVATCRL